MMGYHEHFVRSLMHLQTHAWLPRDEWFVNGGTWNDSRVTAKAQRRAETPMAVRANSRCGDPLDDVRPAPSSAPHRLDTMADRPAYAQAVRSRALDGHGAGLTHAVNVVRNGGVSQALRDVRYL